MLTQRHMQLKMANLANLPNEILHLVVEELVWDTTDMRAMRSFLKAAAKNSSLYCRLASIAFAKVFAGRRVESIPSTWKTYQAMVDNMIEQGYSVTVHGDSVFMVPMPDIQVGVKALREEYELYVLLERWLDLKSQQQLPSNGRQGRFVYLSASEPCVDGKGTILTHFCKW